MMITTHKIPQPKIDLKYYNPNEHYSPYEIVQLMDDKIFELFIIEWLYSQKSENGYTMIEGIGGAGDKGRDIIGRWSDKSVDYYQCKHYKEAVNMAHLLRELAKLCYYTYHKEIPIPKKYFIIASNNLTPTLSDTLSSPDIDDILTEELIKKVDYLIKEITKKEYSIDLEEFKEYIKNFDFSIVTHIPIQQIIDEHLSSKYGSIRFGSKSIDKPKSTVPVNIEDDERRYVSALLAIYSARTGKSISTPGELEEFARYFSHFGRQREAYFAAESVRRVIRDTTVNMDEFDDLKNEVYEGVVETYDRKYADGYDRLQEVLSQASRLPLTNNILCSTLKWIGNPEKKGICHMLVNDKKIEGWEDNE